MHALKFETTVLDNGIIKIPEIKFLVNKKVEIFIIEKTNHQSPSERPKVSFEEFSKKWAGFLKGAEVANWRSDYVNYLEEKYK